MPEKYYRLPTWTLRFTDHWTYNQPVLLELAAAVLIVTARLSWYDPGLCSQLPVNCFDPANAFNMAAGHDARDWYGKALACPPEFSIGTQFVIRGSRWQLADGVWTCLDRGGRIVIDDDGVVWLDLLTDKPIWGEVLPVIVRLPPPPAPRHETEFRKGNLQ